MIHIYYRTSKILCKPPIVLIMMGVLGALFFFLFGVGIGSYATHKEYANHKIQVVEEVVYVTEPYREFSVENLRNYIEELNIRFPHIVYAQAVHETGHFTSPIFRENNNLFGMKVARLRPTTALGTRRGHAYYTDWMNSVKDYALYQTSYLRHIRTEDDYFSFLGDSYAEDENYVQLLQSIIGVDDLAVLFEH